MPRAGGRLRIGLDWEVDALDPPASFGGWNTGRVAQQVYESLVEDDLYDEASSVTRLIPALAERVEVSADGLTYLFDLRQGVRFHDGAPWNAHAAKVNYERIWDENSSYFSSIAADYNRVGVEAVASIKVLHEYSLEIKLIAPFPEFLRYMTQEDAPGSQVFISPEALRKHGDSGIADNAPGTGPFRFGERFETANGSALTVDRSDGYWSGEPLLDGLDFLPYPDAKERTRALISGEIDLAYGLDGADLDDLAERGFIVHSGAVPYIWYFIFNMEAPYLADRRVRRAIAHGFNRQHVSSSIFSGHTRLATGMLPPASPSFDPDFSDPYPYDPDRARALLAEAGVPSDFSFKVNFAAAGSAQLLPANICLQLQTDLATLGVRVELAPQQDWVNYCIEWRSGMPAEVGMSEMSWGMSCDVWLEQILHSRNQSPRGVNAGRFANPFVDQLLDAGRIQMDEQRRRRLYRQAHELVMSELPVLPVATVHAGAVVHHPRVQGFKYPKQNWNCFRRVWLAD